MTQGSRATRNGRAAEQVVAAILAQRGYAPKRQYPIGKSIFGTSLFADFFVPSVPTHPSGLIIESKWQQVGGSAEEKLCYLVANIQAVYPYPAIVMIDGAGFRPGAIQWIKSQAGRGQFVAAFSLAEFLSWSNQSL